MLLFSSDLPELPDDILYVQPITLTVLGLLVELVELLPDLYQEVQPLQAELEHAWLVPPEADEAEDLGEVLGEGDELDALQPGLVKGYLLDFLHLFERLEVSAGIPIVVNEWAVYDALIRGLAIAGLVLAEHLLVVEV